MPTLTNLAEKKTVNTADEVLAILGKRFRDGRWAFRGHREANWSLDPTLERLQFLEGTSRETVGANS
jgi:hypothetical protein